MIENYSELAKKYQTLEQREIKDLFEESAFLNILDHCYFEETQHVSVNFKKKSKNIQLRAFSGAELMLLIMKALDGGYTVTIKHEEG